MPTQNVSTQNVSPADEDHRSLRTAELFRLHALSEDPEEQRELLDEVVLLNLPVADAIAMRYLGRGFPSDDLVQVARLALVRVSRSFRLDYERDFLAYAVPSIRGELRKHFRDSGWVVRPPRRVQEAQLTINLARPRLTQELGREPTVTEVADAVGLDPETVIETLAVDSCYRPDCLDRPIAGLDGDGSGPLTLGSLLGEDDQGYELCETRTDLAPLIAALAPRDRIVLRLRFVEGLTQSEVGQRIGVTQMQVSRILARVLAQLRSELLPESRAA